MISVVIPTHNSEQGLARTLSSLVTAAAEGVIREVVIVDGGSSDGTKLVAEAAGCILLERPGPWGDQVQAGIDAMRRAPWVLVLTPYVDLDAAWFREASLFIERVERAGRIQTESACFRLEFDSFGWQARAAERIVGWGSALLGWHVADQGLLLPRVLWDRIAARRVPVTYAGLVRQIGRRSVHMLRATGVVVEADGHQARLLSGGRLLRYCLSGVGMPGMRFDG